MYKKNPTAVVFPFSVGSKKRGVSRVQINWAKGNRDYLWLTRDIMGAVHVGHCTICTYITWHISAVALMEILD